MNGLPSSTTADAAQAPPAPGQPGPAATAAAAAPVRGAAAAEPARGRDAAPPLWRVLVLEWVPRLLVSAVFLYAGWSKLRNVESMTQFVKEVRAYQLAPLAASNVIAYTMPWLELLAISCLLVGLFRRESRILLVGMLSLFLFAKGYAYLVHGMTECGCVPKDSLMYPLFHGATGYFTNLVLIGLLILEGWAGRTHRQRRRSAAPATHPA